MYLIDEETLWKLLYSDILLNSLCAEGVEDWRHYYDALDMSGLVEWSEEYGMYVSTDKVNNYMLDFDKTNMIEELEGLSNMLAYKIENYEQKETQFAKGAASGLIYAHKELEDILYGN